jgi:hypothetical protein
MLAAQMIGNAIAELHGVPTARARRLELRHKLLDAQAGIGVELQVFSQPMDLTEIADLYRGTTTGRPLTDALFRFACLEESPDPAKLEAEAREAIREHPLASLFAAAHLDDEGKVISRSPGSGVGELDASTLAQQVAQAESLRRHVVVAGKIEPVRQIILSENYVSDEAFTSILPFSPFVPPDLVGTFARGFARYFQGDHTSALYILAPLVENSLRHLLKAHGHDVTTFDNATQTQQDRTITALYDGMRPELDEIFTKPIVDDIERVFLAKPGPHLRHGVSHGLLHDGTPYGTDANYACWMVLRLCLYPLIPHRQALGLSADEKP